MIIDIITLIFFAISSYYLGIAVFSFLPLIKNPKELFPTRFAVVIPAHNEASVIGDLIKSIKASSYSRDLISIYVIADGCTDKTTEISTQLGASVIQKHASSCKGDALAFAFNYLKHKEYDYVVVFDADNICDKNFFNELNEKIALGYYAIQGYIDSKNPNENWVSNAYSIWYWITNRLFLLGRSKLNLGIRLGGTGFAIKKTVLEKIPWSTETIAEDAEYSCLLALNKIKITFAEKAVVYDEKPTSFSQSVNQRKRWAKGICNVQGIYTLKLLLKGQINTVLGLWGDFLFPFSLFILLLISIVTKTGMLSLTSGKITAYLFIASTIIFSLLSLVKDKKLNSKTLLNFFGFFIYIISWIFVGISGIFSKNTTWFHTSHKPTDIHKKG